MSLDLSLVGVATAPEAVQYTWKDVVLYALGVGAKASELDFLYEGRGPLVMPGFPVVLTFPGMLSLVGRTGGNLSMVVHGAERVVLHAPLPSSGRLFASAKIRGIYDLKRFAQVLVDSALRDERGELVAETTASIVFRGEGGFGGEPPPKEPPPVDRPKGEPPTFAVEEATSPEQALLYRLSGDLNPLHADPAFASAVGFERGPILHGLCTFGFMARHVARGACGGDATRVRALEAQFRRPVWPGETLVTEGWHVRSDAVAVQVRAKERDEVVIGGAWALLA
ncbi:MAG TPA: MaoC/PaaZ C-terminal domain-containing protein [Polyangiaceae bacterium]|nr:MaoC/PaaZ C-terminal domain-containing protein [Polyangiaceae bacterium]